MIAAGCLEDGSRIRAGLARGAGVSFRVHRGRYGYTHASSDVFDITVRGVKSHGANPEARRRRYQQGGADCHGGAEYRRRNIAATDPRVITIGKFHAGAAGSIIADQAELTGTIRTTSSETRYRAMQRLERDGGGCGKGDGRTGFRSVSSRVYRTEK